MILYFTGTGNSEFVAKAIAAKTQDEAVNILPYVQGEKGNFSSEKPYVIVFPVYLSDIPVVVKDFLRQSEFGGNPHFYFAATCASAMGSVPNEAKRILKKMTGKVYMGCARFVMPQNYIALFKMTEPEEQERRLAQALKDVELFATDICEGKPVLTGDALWIEYSMTEMVAVMYNKLGTGTGRFRTTDECVGCGLCEKQCPMNNIRMENGRPKWIKNCVHCMACINKCPKNAVEIGKKTVGKARYVCKKYETQV